MSAAGEEQDFSTRIRDQIEDWLQQEGWQVGHQTAVGVRWLLTVRDVQGRPLVIAHTAQGRDNVLVQLGIRLEDNLQQQVAGLPPHERRNLLFDMHEGLMLMGIQWVGIKEPLREFSLVSSCYFDGLSKNELLRLIRTVRDGGILTMEKIARVLNQPPPPQLEPEHRGIGFRT